MKRATILLQLLKEAQGRQNLFEADLSEWRRGLDTTSSVANYTPGASQLPVLGSDAAGFLRTGAENAAAI